MRNCQGSSCKVSFCPQDLKIFKDLEITIASEVASTKIEIDLGVLRSSFSSSVLITTLYLHFVLSRKLSFKNGKMEQNYVGNKLNTIYFVLSYTRNVCLENHLTLFDIFIINGISPHQLWKYKCHESLTGFPFTIHILYFPLK